MTRFRPLAALALATLLAAAPASAQSEGDAPAAAGGDTLAIYQNDLALVTTRRPVALEPGTATLAIDRISPRIVPGSLEVAGDGLRLVEQSLAPWPLDRRSLLEAFVGREVTLVRPAEGDNAPVEESATILSIADGLVVRIDDKVEVDPDGRIVFPELPQRLSASPRADVRVQVDDAGERTLQVRYLTRGLAWDADYVARYDEDAGRLHLTALAELSNALPVPFTADSVRLVAGEVSQVRERAEPQAQRRAMAATARTESADAAGVPTPKTRSDLKVYPLARAVELPAGSSVRVPLMAAKAIAVERQYRVLNLATAYPYNGARGPSAAQVRLHVPDTRAAGLDAGLPAGTLRVYQAELYRGAQRIDDIPAGGELTVDLGRAFDVTATARQTAFAQLGERQYETAQEITVKNAKARAVTVQVVGAFPPDWEMRAESAAHTRRNASTPVWTLEVPPEGETVLSYRVRVRR
jgi:hypothetical protein